MKYIKEIDDPADIVIASQGGAPKDLNLYQTQKALDNAAHAVKEGGVIILVGTCIEGFGGKVFEEWMTTSPSAEYMIEQIRKDFQLGGHKAAAIAMVLQKADIFLVSDLPDDLVRSISENRSESVTKSTKAVSAAFQMNKSRVRVNQAVLFPGESAADKDTRMNHRHTAASTSILPISHKKNCLTGCP